MFGKLELIILLPKLSDEVPDRIPDRAGRILNNCCLRQIELRVGGQTLDFERVTGRVIGAHDDDGFLGEARSLIEVVFVIDDVNIRGG